MKTLKELIEGYEESSPQDIQDIIKNMKVNTYVDPSIKDDEDAFTAKKTKTIPRKKERHGYSDAEDDKASDKLTGADKKRVNEGEADSTFIDRAAAKIAKGLDLSDKKEDKKKKEVREEIEDEDLFEMYVDVITQMIQEADDEERAVLIEALEDDNTFNDVMDAIDEAIVEDLNEEK